ncbi:lipase family protein [Pantanalinema rosaneae CENA516]|uniref:lipase family protein n=1 Tax=Pantanalinema rosaneae TaxID=1620701 RepID=UPI003D6E97FF
MAKLNRRQLLVTGLGAGAASAAAIAHHMVVDTDPVAAQPIHAQVVTDAVESLFDYDGDVETGGEDRLNPPTSQAIQPTIPYDRDISKLLVLCSQLALEQFQAGERNPRYNGNIRSLPSYSNTLDRYTQTTSISVMDDGSNLPVELRVARSLLGGPGQNVPVYFGFVLKSADHNIVVFRGTQTTRDWLANLQLEQSDYMQAGINQGRVHRGFFRLYNTLAPQTLNAVNQLDPRIPCYITGYSLGGALATLAAADLAANNPKLKDQLRLYTYASPRVGNPAFANFYEQMVPNTYRIINLTDTVVMVPPSEVRNQEYRHVGQPWSFVFYTGDIAPNHAITLYRAAINDSFENYQA